MRRLWLLNIIILFVTLTACIADEKKQDEKGYYKKDAGVYKVLTVEYDWKDSKVKRNVPVKIYYPDIDKKPRPVILFSHGLGGTRYDYEYLGNHWASYGYVCIHLQHIGTDDAFWEKNNNPNEAAQNLTKNPKLVMFRVLDVKLVVDKLEKINGQDGIFKGRLDLEKIGIAGHSLGAHTTMFSVGMGKALSWRARNFHDPRIKAAITMSPPAPTRMKNYDKLFKPVKVPCLHLTGTKDAAITADTKPEQRRIPFDHINGSDQYLVIFEGGDHMVFNNGSSQIPKMYKNKRDNSKDSLFHDLILMSTTAFWDSYLMEDENALKWLAEGGFEECLSNDGTFEKKIKD
jgi:predicted dienelactone hydrolase